MNNNSDFTGSSRNVGEEQVPEVQSNSAEKRSLTPFEGLITALVLVTMLGLFAVMVYSVETEQRNQSLIVSNQAGQDETEYKKTIVSAHNALVRGDSTECLRLLESIPTTFSGNEKVVGMRQLVTRLVGMKAGYSRILAVMRSEFDNMVYPKSICEYGGDSLGFSITEVVKDAEEVFSKRSKMVKGEFERSDEFDMRIDEEMWRIYQTPLMTRRFLFAVPSSFKYDADQECMLIGPRHRVTESQEKRRDFTSSSWDSYRVAFTNMQEWGDVYVSMSREEARDMKEELELLAICTTENIDRDDMGKDTLPYSSDVEIVEIPGERQVYFCESLSMWVEEIWVINPTRGTILCRERMNDNEEIFRVAIDMPRDVGISEEHSNPDTFEITFVGLVSGKVALRIQTRADEHPRTLLAQVGTEILPHWFLTDIDQNKATLEITNTTTKATARLHMGEVKSLSDSR